jgi:hypothetical protein
MRKDVAKVVTEGPHRGHSNAGSKWGRRLTKDEYSLDDHGASRAPVSRHRPYGWNAKEFSDSLGPLRGYLRKQVGRPWDKVWSEIAATLDSRSLTGQHIFDHYGTKAQQYCGDGHRPDGLNIRSSSACEEANPDSTMNPPRIAGPSLIEQPPVKVGA